MRNYITHQGHCYSLIRISELKQKEPRRHKWDEGFRGTTQIQKEQIPFLDILNAEIRPDFSE
jgi:hypothetical protein